MSPAAVRIPSYRAHVLRAHAHGVDAKVVSGLEFNRADAPKPSQCIIVILALACATFVGVPKP